MTPDVLLLALLQARPHIAAGLGTVFGPSSSDRRSNPHDGLACYRDRPLRPGDKLVAHPSLPCRSKVLVCAPRTGRCATARVGDRGPRHAALDMTPALAQALRHNGREPVLYVPERAPASR